jgi:hypothetical protein
MPNNDMQRIIQKLGNIDNSLGALVRILEVSNKNFVTFTKMIQDDIDRHTFRPIDPTELKPRFELGTHVVINSETDVRDGWRGTIQDIGGVVATVVFEDGSSQTFTGAEMIPLNEKPIKDANELEIPPIIEDSAFSYPQEWRESLGIANIRVMQPDSPKLPRNENRRMSKKEFDMYNNELYAIGVIMNEEDAEGTPDSRGRLKPYEWRHKHEIPQIDPGRGQAHAFDENRLMTEDTFWAYHAQLNATGVVDEKVQSEDKVLDEKWRGDF